MKRKEVKLPKIPGQEKTPFWKKKWFWGVIIAVVIVGAVGGHSDEPSEPAIAYQDTEVLEEIIEEEPEIDEAAKRKAEKEEKSRQIKEEVERINAEREAKKAEMAAEPEVVQEAEEAPAADPESIIEDTPAEPDPAVESEQVTETPIQSFSATEADWVVNIDPSSMKIHYPSCQHVQRMLEENKWEVRTTLDSLLADGYTKCKTCFS